MHLHQKEHLLLEDFGRLKDLRLRQSRAHHIVEALQISCDRSALLLVERGLQVPDHEDRVIDLAGAPLNVASVHRGSRPPQVFDGLLIQ